MLIYFVCSNNKQQLYLNEFSLPLKLSVKHIKKYEINSEEINLKFSEFFLLPFPLIFVQEIENSL